MTGGGYPSLLRAAAGEHSFGRGRPRAGRRPSTGGWAIRACPPARSAAMRSRAPASPQAHEIREWARAYVMRLVEHIRDPIFRELFLKRRVVREICSTRRPRRRRRSALYFLRRTPWLLARPLAVRAAPSWARRLACLRFYTTAKRLRR